MPSSRKKSFFDHLYFNAPLVLAAASGVAFQLEHAGWGAGLAIASGALYVALVVLSLAGNYMGSNPPLLEVPWQLKPGAFVCLALVYLLGRVLRIFRRS